MVSASGGRRGSQKNRKTQNQKSKTINKKIETALKKKEKLNCKKILQILKDKADFIGCFAQDRVRRLIFQHFPCFLLVNVQSHPYSGSHWIALGMFKDCLEIFDPLGFKFYNWDSIPCKLLEFLHTNSNNRKLKISPQIQSLKSKFPHNLAL